ncbi:esterase/lipase family protein [Nocardia pseudobrasiliensis]|uniref:Triacylglycerol esterase/lipase EstA (Alpha/beta hydrolase family) n=1 Tax=Nocardia pseudobrasiliensis TaxID=45979 RepID=A0A370I399_9NOCA|nr:alpha/beta fold hydrolase [Nocardia pseudobrasiliensis]RDI64611.1 triacylglycerol esterase/lipase EstA (alpha/beta hydrolase family) [Nocardia pseudobrasiliensis]
MRRIVRRLAAALSILVAAMIALVPAAAEPLELPEVPGANDLSCRPAPDKPNPVVLVHGSATDAVNSWTTLAPALRKQGYCVFAANLGRAAVLTTSASATPNAAWPGLGPIGAALSGRTLYGVADIATSAAELAGFVATVRAATGAERVALVGHSTGGTIVRAFLKAHPAEADTVVTLGTPYRGSDFAELPAKYPDLASLGMDGPHIAAQVFGNAGVQQTMGSAVLMQLNWPVETVPGVRFTAIASHDDEVITPPDTALLAVPLGADRNVWVQDGCAAHTVDHGHLLVDPHTTALVAAALAGTPFPAC